METKMIGNKIAQARKKTNVSQAQLANRLFISPQAVGKWERGESMPDITTLNRLAEILGVDLNYFSENFKSDADLNDKPVGPGSNNQDKKLNWDMSYANWVDADFSGLKDLHQQFSNSNMQRCKFIASEMSGLLLKHNHVDNCNFSGSGINNSHIEASHLINNRLVDSMLKETKFSKSHIKGCDFSAADFSEVQFKSCSLEKNKIENAVWNHTSFYGTALTDMIFNDTLQNCSFENCGFTRVTFQSATLVNSFFKNNSFFKSKGLKGVKFIDCNADQITYEFLKAGKADLSGITLLSSSNY